MVEWDDECAARSSIRTHFLSDGALPAIPWHSMLMLLRSAFRPPNLAFQARATSNQAAFADTYWDPLTGRKYGKRCMLRANVQAALLNQPIASGPIS